MTPPPPCRLSLVFARSAPIAVLFRRGPTRGVKVIKWNTSTDSFEDGQWLHGNIYSERCDLSPNGELLVYFARRHGPVAEDRGYAVTFTAVSKPPYLTALALWPEGSTWGGGGRFVDDKTLRLAYGSNGTNHPGTGTTSIYMAPLPPPHPNHMPVGLNIQADLMRYGADLGFRDPVTSSDHVWVGRDHNHRSIVARDGSLYRLTEDGKEMLLRDFNTDTPVRVKAPESASRW